MSLSGLSWQMLIIIGSILTSVGLAFNKYQSHRGSVFQLQLYKYLAASAWISFWWWRLNLGLPRQWPLFLIYGCTVNDGVMVCLGRTNCAVMINQAIWDIGAILTLAQETNTHYQFISPPPNLSAGNLKGYQHSLVMGSKQLATKLVKELSALGNK